MIDEARLKAIEAHLPPPGAGPASDAMHELIAALREAWKRQCPGIEEHAHMHTRALRAEAEVMRYQGLLPQIDNLKTYMDPIPYHGQTLSLLPRKDLRALIALREAAEAYMAQIGDVEVGAKERDREYLRLWGNLSRALRACEDILL